MCATTLGFPRHRSQTSSWTRHCVRKNTPASHSGPGRPVVVLVWSAARDVWEVIDTLLIVRDAEPELADDALIRARLGLRGDEDRSVGLWLGEPAFR